MQVSDDDAVATARTLSQTEGIMCGISSGASVCAQRVPRARRARPRGPPPPEASRRGGAGLASPGGPRSHALLTRSRWAAKQIAARPENKGKTIVCIIPSFGERYLSTVLYADLWEEASAQKAEPLE